jgi:hypothetical protein
MTEIEKLQKEFDDMHTIFVQNEIHCYVMSEIISIRGLMGVSIADQMSPLVERKSKEYKEFARRVGAMAKLASEAKVYNHNTRNRMINIFPEEKFDDNVAYLSGHIQNLYSMDAEQVTLALNATEMIKEGFIPTFTNLSASQLQEISKKINIPFEYVSKIVTELQNVTISK